MQDPMNNEEFEEALIKAAKLVAENMGCPNDVFHPDYGWIVRNGKGTEEGLKFYEEVLKPELEKAKK